MILNNKALKFQLDISRREFPIRLQNQRQNGEQILLHNALIKRSTNNLQNLLINKWIFSLNHLTKYQIFLSRHNIAIHQYITNVQQVLFHGLGTFLCWVRQRQVDDGQDALSGRLVGFLQEGQEFVCDLFLVEG